MFMFKSPQNEGDAVYHYTSQSSLSGILKKDKIVLQLTKLCDLDDKTEGTEIFNHFEKACNNLLKQKKITDEQYKKILELKNDCTSKMFTICFKNDAMYIDYKETDAYIMSFCKDDDNIFMWEEYAGQDGCCIHFNEKYLKKLFINPFEHYINIEEVVYDDDKKVEILEECIFENLKDEDYLRRIKNEISSYKYLFKKKSFENEKEIRMIVYVPKSTDNLTFETKFKFKGNKKLSYIELEIIEPEIKMFLVNGITLNSSFEKNSYENIKKYLWTSEYFFTSVDINFLKI